jgi:hypothetical protein
MPKNTPMRKKSESNRDTKKQDEKKKASQKPQSKK